MRGVPAVAAGFVFALSPLGCSISPELPETNRELRSEVVYGEDDRAELHAVNTTLRAIGERSVAALIDTAAPSGVGADPRAFFSAPSWGERRKLCSGVRFAEQPAVASCTGVLVDDDLVMTAGHCARSLACETLLLVFGYYYGDDGAERALSSSDVYSCAEVVTFEVPSVRGSLDYGFIRLDRSVSPDKHPVTVEHRAVSVDGERLGALGFSGGVPLKAHAGETAHDARREALDYFTTALDVFEGASGGPVIRADGTVVGIVAAGSDDYTVTADDCLVPSVLPASAAIERATYAFQAVAGLCEQSTASERLCRHSPAGAGSCSFSGYLRRDFALGAASVVLSALGVALTRLRRAPARRIKRRTSSSCATGASGSPAAPLRSAHP